MWGRQDSERLRDKGPVKTLAKWLLKLYPRQWRIRYQDELTSVIEAHRVTLVTFVDLCIGIIHAYFTYPRAGLWKFRFAVAAIAATMVCGSVYTVAQQNLRMAANHPQTEMAISTANSLSQGQSLRALLPDRQTDIATSLDPFVIVYNNHGVPMGSSGLLDGQIPMLPSGVFAYTRQHGEEKVTWQPRPGVRIAAVVVQHAGKNPGFVLVGRSLRETEASETLLEIVVGLFWAISIGLAGTVFAWKSVRRNPV